VGYICMRSLSIFWPDESINHQTNDNTCLMLPINQNCYSNNDWQDWIQFFSMHYGDSAEPWLRWYYCNHDDQDQHGNEYHDDDNNNTRDLILTTLLRLNIISVIVTEQEQQRFRLLLQKTKSSRKGKDSDCSTSTRAKKRQKQPTQPPQQQQQQQQKQAMQGWPFHPLYSLRSAVQRIESAVLDLPQGNFGCDDVGVGVSTKDVSKLLLSSVHIPDYFDSTNNKDKNEMILQPPRGGPIFTVPILDYIQNEEIFCHIFSFCSVKRLGKLEHVCQVWKSTIDRHTHIVWKDAYISRFGPVYIGTTDFAIHSQSDVSLSTTFVSASWTWKVLFRNKLVAERNIRYHRHAKTGFKFRTCPYVGCLFVMKSDVQQRQHLRKHIHHHERHEERRHRMAKRVDCSSERKKRSITTDTKQQMKSAQSIRSHRKRCRCPTTVSVSSATTNGLPRYM
jgi:hypothetical protein